ncbi:cytochrome c biogenesis protein CcdA [Lachnospiraceae bacterium 62-35]
MGFSFDMSIPAVMVFFQGLLSFFSPCVLPLLPLYIGYLSGGAGKRGEDGRISYARKRVMINTLFFIVGISFAFFLLGLGFSIVGMFFKSNQIIFARIGGILVILFGLYQLGLFGSFAVLGKERRLPIHLDTLAISPVTALLLGFTFSFAWTPCVGPALTSVLLMAASAETRAVGFLLIGLYTLGLVLPFLAVGFFASVLLEFFKKHGNVVKYTVKLGAVLMICMGILMITGKVNDMTGYLSGGTMVGEESVGNKADQTGGESPTGSEEKSGGPTGKEQTENGFKEEGSVSGEEGDDWEKDGRTASEANSEEENPTESEAENEKVIPAVDFQLKDQYGNVHSLEDYKGKTIFLNFWATWCPPCRAEMPDIQKLYETYEKEGEEALIVLGVAAPGFSGETSEQGIGDFLNENGYTYPVLMDTTGEVFYTYGITSYPTTFMIDRNGNVFGYISGQLSEDMMEEIIRQTMEGKRRKAE